ncbi:hypothetical protein V8E54_006941 [Elaphomyces granulatus]
MLGQKVCRQFARTGNCKYKGCKLEHVVDKEHNQKKSGGASSSSNSETEFRKWRNNIPLEPKSARALGKNLAVFFQESERLIKIDANLMQDVISCLSKEGGLKRIKELIEQEFHNMSTAVKASLFKTEILPFFQSISHPDVLASLVLEQSVGTIYNIIFGINGRRAIPLFSCILDVLTAASKCEETTVAYLERSLVVFSRMLESNSTAFVQESLIPLAKGFQEIFIAIYESNGQGPLYEAREYLERIQQCLAIGSSLPAVYPASKIVKEKPAVAFVISREPPGGRHDNDHVDICNIKIMPTFQEIMSSRTEYLPVKDPMQWCIPGLDGLLDKNFRLLREDTIGQLRDAIQPELQKLLTSNVSTPKNEKQHQLRTYIYDTARLVNLSFDKLSGLSFEVQFPQPPNVHKMAANKRQEWWQISKRLQADALVCLADSQGCITFCTTVGSEKGRKPGEQKRDPDGLWKNEKIAAVFLRLVEKDDESIQHILNNYRVYTPPTFSLVEFPGVLLPSFQPTLLALQSMKKTRNLPFSEFLAPSDPNVCGSVDVPPPIYALKPGFSFKLRCLMNDNADLELKPGQPFDIDKLQKNSSLDRAQAIALVNTLQRRIGLIQGPPGTGKSYTGVSLVKVLVTNRNGTDIGPVICVCYTNHALDQLLEDLLESGITSQIIRIGSQSKSEKLEPFNLRVVAGNLEKTRKERRGRYELGRRLDEFETDYDGLFPKLRTTNSGIAIKIHLKMNYIHHHEQLFGVDVDGFQKAGSSNPQTIIRQWLRSGQHSNGNLRHLEQLQTANIHQLSMEEREVLHRHWVEEIRDDLHAQTQQLFSDHYTTKLEFDSIRDELDLRCLRKADVIGVTTTGLARNLNLLRRVRSKVVLCEEAGEVLEAHILTSLLPSVEHVILIGDHLQLRPQIQNYELSRENRRGEQYSLDMSLFERLVQPGSDTAIHLPYSTLETQRRMHPSIAQLVRDTLYPQLKDSPNVFEYPPVSGMLKRLFWLDHKSTEADTSNVDAMATSHWNDHEIGMAAALANHLIKQGVYKSGDIAILTPYLGQLHRLRRHLSTSFAVVLGERDQDDLEKAGFGDNDETNTPIAKATLLKTLRIATIDNFQGEEAKVVVISLVRSNEQNKCGFLRTSNRINVLLSRAKHGMYIIGNSATSSHVPMWAQVIEILRGSGNFGNILQLQCPRHPEFPIEVSEPDHFLQYSPEGGCDLQCINRLPCGHGCVQKCHSELLHNAVYCPEPCLRPRKGCDHSCLKRCGDPCPAKCNFPVFKAERVLPCGHLEPNLPCWQDKDLSSVRCHKAVEKVVPVCKHQVVVHCYIDVANVKRVFFVRTRHPIIMLHASKNVEGNFLRVPTHVKPAVMDKVPALHVRLLVMSTAAIRDVGTNVGSHVHPVQKRSACLPVHTVHVPCLVLPLVTTYRVLSAARRSYPAVISVHQSAEKLVLIRVSARFAAMRKSETMKLISFWSMDAQMDIKRYYVVDANEKPVAIATSSEPFSMKDIKTCAICRGSLRDVSRYGRLVRRALLDESTKKFILYVNREYVPLAGDVPRQIKLLQDKPGDATTRTFSLDSPISIGGTPENQIRTMLNLLNKQDKTRWSNIIRLRDRIGSYLRKVGEEEQPFNRVRFMVEIARKRRGATGTFSFDETILHTKGFHLALALIVRLDIALLADFLSLRRGANHVPINSELILDFQSNRNACDILIKSATASHRIPQQVEGHIFLAQLYALEQLHCRSPKVALDFLTKAHAALDVARGLCNAHRNQTKGLSDEIDATEGLLRGSTFYTAVTTEERLEVISAMAREFSGTGHWYYCQNGHPFTIGECGMGMEMAICPECHAPVGGRNHQHAAGVSHATDLDQTLRDLRIG